MTWGKDLHPKRFPIKPALGHKGGSILWEDAVLVASQVFASTAQDSTDHIFGMQQIACGGGITADRMDSTVQYLVGNGFFAGGKPIPEWRASFQANNHNEWRDKAIAIFSEAAKKPKDTRSILLSPFDDD